MATGKVGLGSTVLWLMALSVSAVYADNTTAPKLGAKAAFHPPAEGISQGQLATKSAQELGAERGWVFSAPPRGKAQEEQAIYQPIVDFLARTTGHKIIYKHSSNWLSYSKDMSFGQFDLVFDGPHFNGWRQERLQHTPLVKLPDDFVFVVVARVDDPLAKDLKSLAGRRVCAHAPPNLGTLTMLSAFDGPLRQPVLIETQGWENAYAGLIAGKCLGTVLPLKNWKKFDDKHRTRVLYQHRALPNQAISAGPAIPPDMQVKITNALLSDEGRQITQKLLDAYAAKAFVPADPKEYAGLGSLLKDMLYYQ